MEDSERRRAVKKVYALVYTTRYSRCIGAVPGTKGMRMFDSSMRVVPDSRHSCLILLSVAGTVTVTDFHENDHASDLSCRRA